MFGGQLISTRSHARTHDNRLLLINLDGWSDHVTEKPSMADRHDGFRFAPRFRPPRSNHCRHGKGAPGAFLISN
jgi:hypothetical protein